MRLSQARAQPVRPSQARARASPQQGPARASPQQEPAQASPQQGPARAQGLRERSSPQEPGQEPQAQANRLQED